MFSKQKFHTKFPQLCHSSRQRGSNLKGFSSHTIDQGQLNSHILSRNRSFESIQDVDTSFENYITEPNIPGLKIKAFIGTPDPDNINHFSKSKERSGNTSRALLNHSISKQTMQEFNLKESDVSPPKRQQFDQGSAREGSIINQSKDFIDTNIRLTERLRDYNKMNYLSKLRTNLDNQESNKLRNHLK